MKTFPPICPELVGRFFARLGLWFLNRPSAGACFSKRARNIESSFGRGSYSILRRNCHSRASKDFAAKLDEMLPIPKADGPFGDGIDDIAKKWRSSRGIERALSLLDGSINHFVVRSKGSLALQFDEDIQIVAHLVEATATVNRPQEARRVARIVRSCVDLQPDMAALANPDTMSVEAETQTILDRWESFKRSQVRCVTLCASERLKDRRTATAGAPSSNVGRFDVSGSGLSLRLVGRCLTSPLPQSPSLRRKTR